MNFYDDEYVIFDNTERICSRQNTFSFLTDQTGYNYSEDLNPDCPPPYYFNNQDNNQDNNQKSSDMNLVEDLFNTNLVYEEKQDISTLIDIYEKTEEKSGEFIDVKFRANLLPFRLEKLSYMTSLYINKCTLDEISYLPPLLEFLKINNCGLKIISCKSYPSTLIEMNLSNNDIELICDFEPLIKLKKLILDDNSLTYINDIPKSVEIISLKQNKLTKITFLMEFLKEVYLNKNQINDIEELLDSVEILDISNNNIGMIYLLSENLKILNAYNCKLKKILCKFPPKLKKLDLFSNSLETVPDFPDSLEWVDLSSNELLYLPKNIKNLKYFDISNNPNLAVNPNDESLKDFMMGMQDNKQFMMNFDEDKKSEEIYISSDVGTTSDDEDDNDIDENFNDSRFKQKLLNVHAPEFKPMEISNDNYATFSFNKKENLEKENLEKERVDEVSNDNRLKQIINNIRQMKHKEKRYVKFYKSYTC